MEVDNDTNTPVNYDQSGGDGTVLPEQAQAEPRPPCPRQGALGAKGSDNNTARFVPGCPPPWRVTFTDPDDPGKEATSRPLQPREINATVTLNPDWTVTVS